MNTKEKYLKEFMLDAISLLHSRISTFSLLFLWCAMSRSHNIYSKLWKTSNNKLLTGYGLIIMKAPDTAVDGVTANQKLGLIA
jgi:GT2 family glycosyltransferase